MTKKLEDMTDDERIAHWQKVRKEVQEDRQEKVNELNEAQREAALTLFKQLDDILDVALYPGMGGLRCVTAIDLQDLDEAKNVFKYQFNL